MAIKKYDYIINDNGDIWMVSSVHRDGAMTITHSDGSDITYTAGQIESWFRKLPEDVGESNFDRSGWVDPAPYWSGEEEPKPVRQPKARTKKAKKNKSGVQTSLGGMR